MTSEGRFGNGAMAMLDILGFKGVWRRHSASSVLARMHKLSVQVPQIIALPGFAGISLRRAYRYWSELKISFQFLSDTIVIGVMHEQCDDLALQVAVQALGKLVAQVSQIALEGEPVFALRGAISVGEFTISENFVIGEAVDDAAAHMNLADAAVTWTTPAAMAR